MKRFKRLSRYALITWAFREAIRLSKLDNSEQTKVIDNHLGHLLEYYSPIRVAEIVRIWYFSKKIWANPNKMKNFDEFHSKCGAIVVIKNELNKEGSQFFLYAKNKMEFITRVRINRPDMPTLIRDYLKTEVGYSPMSQEEYAELKKSIDDHLRELKFNPKAEDLTFTLEAWRIGRLSRTLDRLYGKDSPE